MNFWVPAIGAASFGVVIGFLIRYFITRFKSFTPQALSSVVSITAGGVAVKFFSENHSLIWFYPIGLLLGFATYQIIATREVRRIEQSAETPKAKAETKGASGGGGWPKGALFDKRRD